MTHPKKKHVRQQLSIACWFANRDALERLPDRTGVDHRDRNA